MGSKRKNILTEREIIAEIAEQLKGYQQDNVIQGIGDDCAVCRIGENRVSLFTTDTLVESVHFDRSWHPADLLGRKAASVNISDIAAMGGAPQYALLSLGISRLCDQEWVDGFLYGFREVLEEYNISLIGGDTIKSGELFMVSVTVIGEMADDKVCYRSGAKEGDLIWVSGYLGEAAAGLEICRNKYQTTEQYRSLIMAHINPEPKVKLGMQLAKSGLPHAMMDISDGLATDLAHICKASKVGAEIMASEIPLSKVILKAAGELKRDPLGFALQGGEDYQLVFTSSPENKEKVISLGKTVGQKVSCVGRIVPGSRVFLCTDEEKQDITYKGYEHKF
jgi:thiamine-monophosphate kinase